MFHGFVQSSHIGYLFSRGVLSAVSGAVFGVFPFPSAYARFS